MQPAIQYIIIPILVTLLLIQFFLYRRGHGFIVASNLAKRTRRVVTILLAVLFIGFNVILVVAASIPLTRGTSFSPVGSELWSSTTSTLLYPLAIWQAGSLGSFLVIVFMDALSALRTWLWRPNRAESEAAPARVSRREFVRQLGGGLAALPFSVSAYGAYVASQGARIERVPLALPPIPDSLRGLKIVQLTDIHVGPFMSQERLEEYVKIVNRLEPDLVVITGDFVSSSNRYVRPAVQALAKLRPRLGVFGSIGNHELYTDAVSPLIEGFAQNNMKILLNEQVYLAHNGARLNLIGIEYVDRGATRVERCLRGISLDGPTILLSHQPNVFPKAAERGIDVTLAGHTHGGQVNLNLLGWEIGPAHAITPYVAGLFELNESKLYVSRGLGTSGPPIRVNAPPEITLITLT